MSMSPIPSSDADDARENHGAESTPPTEPTETPESAPTPDEPAAEELPVPAPSESSLAMDHKPDGFDQTPVTDVPIAADESTTGDVLREMESDVVLPAITSPVQTTPPNLPEMSATENAPEPSPQQLSTDAPPVTSLDGDAAPSEDDADSPADEDDTDVHGVPALDTSTITLSVEDQDKPVEEAPETLLQERPGEPLTTEGVELPAGHTLPHMGERTRRLANIGEQASQAAQETQAAVNELKETAATLSSQVEKTDQLLQAVVHIAERVGGLSTQVAALARNTGTIQNFLGKIGAQLQAFEAHLNKLTGFFNDRFKEDRVKDRALSKLEDSFDLLYEEMRQYKDNFLHAAQKPVFVDLIHLYDDLGKMADATTDEEAKARFEFAREMVLEILYRRDIETFTIEPGKPFDSTVQKAIRREDTDDPEQDRQVAAVLRAGFRLGETIFRPEEVVVLRYSDEAEPSPEAPTETSTDPPSEQPVTEEPADMPTVEASPEVPSTPESEPEASPEQDAPVTDPPEPTS